MIRLIREIPKEALQWRNDPSIWKWCRQNRPLSPVDHESWKTKIEKNPNIIMFAIEAVTPVGVCGLTSIDRINQSAEFSLYIAPEYQKKGYGRLGLTALFNHGFYHENLNRIWGESFEGNPAIYLFEALGMKREGCLKQSYYREGKFIDSHIFSLIRAEWMGRRV